MSGTSVLKVTSTTRATSGLEFVRARSRAAPLVPDLLLGGRYRAHAPAWGAGSILQEPERLEHDVGTRLRLSMARLAMRSPGEPHRRPTVRPPSDPRRGDRARAASSTRRRRRRPPRAAPSWRPCSRSSGFDQVDRLLPDHARHVARPRARTAAPAGRPTPAGSHPPIPST